MPRRRSVFFFFFPASSRSNVNDFRRRGFFGFVAGFIPRKRRARFRKIKPNGLRRSGAERVGSVFNDPGRSVLWVFFFWGRPFSSSAPRSEISKVRRRWRRIGIHFFFFLFFVTVLGSMEAVPFRPHSVTGFAISGFTYLARFLGRATVRTGRRPEKRSASHFFFFLTLRFPRTRVRPRSLIFGRGGGPPRLWAKRRPGI